MVYSLTDKLHFSEDPQIEIKGKTITVKSDAETVLELMDIITNKGELAASTAAFGLLFSEKDQKTIKALKLKVDDYVLLMETALTLALGNDPDENLQGER